MRQRLDLRQTQTLALTPMVRLSLSILRMAPAELTEEIAREAARNPFLRHEGPRNRSLRGPAPASTLPEPEARETSFQESLCSQLSQLDLPQATAALALFLVSELRDDGILDVTLPELAEETGAPLPELEKALHAVQSCEPAGIGARDLSECLTLQLIDLGLPRADAAQTVASMALFAARDWPALQRRLQIDQPEAERQNAKPPRLGHERRKRGGLQRRIGCVQYALQLFGRAAQPGGRAEQGACGVVVPSGLPGRGRLRMAARQITPAHRRQDRGVIKPAAQPVRAQRAGLRVAEEGIADGAVPAHRQIAGTADGGIGAGLGDCRRGEAEGQRGGEKQFVAGHEQSSWFVDAC